MPNCLYSDSNQTSGEPKLNINYGIDLQHRSGKTKQINMSGATLRG